jgi:L-threonylcarbamoyladenylate synthase
VALKRDVHAPGALQAAVEVLLRGHLVGMPTETVYGLAADADNAQAVARIFAAKGRPSDHPLIVHVAAQSGHNTWRDAVHHYAQDVPECAWRLMEAAWPGPLTVIVPRRTGVGEAAAGGQATIGLRCPGHAATQALLQAAQQRGIWGIAAPSANRFGRVSPTTAQHVMDEFAEDLSDDALLVLDAGPCPVGIESTIVDASRGRLVLLRPGMLDIQALSAELGVTFEAADAHAPKASGTLESHYAPRAKVVLVNSADMASRLSQLSPQEAQHTALYVRQRVDAPLGLPPVAHLHPMPHTAAACAQELFAVLRQLDRTGIKSIWVETPPADPTWDGVRDRLTRAAA